MKRKLFLPATVIITLLFAGVALADSNTDATLPVEPEFRVGDQVNGGRVIEVTRDEIVVEFVDRVRR